MKSELISIRPDARVKSNGCHGTLEREVWRPVKGYEGLYEVSSFGRVRSLDRVEVWRGTTRPRKGRIKVISYTSIYPKITLYNGKSKTFSIHRLVAEAFIPNPDNLPQVNHRNEVKTSNYPDNLEWCDAKYNINYGLRNKLAGNKMRGRRQSDDAVQKNREARRHYMKPVLQYTLNGEFVAEYESTSEASRKSGLKYTDIQFCCANKRNRRTAGGFIWRYKK